MSRIVTRELAQEEAEALVAAQAKQQTPAPAAPAATEPTVPAKALPATPQPDITKPVTTGPGGDTRDSGQPSVHETLTKVAEEMKKTNG